MFEEVFAENFVHESLKICRRIRQSKRQFHKFVKTKLRGTKSSFYDGLFLLLALATNHWLNQATKNILRLVMHLSFVPSEENDTRPSSLPRST